MIPTVLGVLFIIFAILEMTPGDAALNSLGTSFTEEQYQAKLVELGLDKPFFIRYLEYVWNVITRFDLGTSYMSLQTVSSLIGERVGITLQLGLISCLFTVVIGVFFGIIAAVKQYSALDYTASSLAIFFSAAPAFWLGLMMILLFTVRLGWLPAAGLHSWKGYIMPIFCMGITPIAIVLRMTRSSMLDVIRQDYIRTARAKGVPERKVIFSHALKNALIPVITVIGMQISMIVGGSVVIESIFSIPGIGMLMISSINSRDYPTVQGVALVTCLFVCVFNLVTDIAYAAADPRIRAEYEGESGKKFVPFRRLKIMRKMLDGGSE